MGSVVLVIEPLDTIFTRDHRPFGAGDTTYGRSIFPTSLTVYGMLGHSILRRNGMSYGEFRQMGHPVLGCFDGELKKSGLRVKGPFIIHWSGTLYFPAPANLFTPLAKVNVAFPSPLDGRKWDLGNSLRPLSVPCKNGYREERVEGYISGRKLVEYLAGNTPDLRDVRKTTDIFERETRVGHKLASEKKVVEEHFLYFADHLRFSEKLFPGRLRKTSLLAIAEGDKVNGGVFSEKTARLGGEGKRVRIEVVNGNSELGKQVKDVFSPPEGLGELISEKRRFFVYCATPSIFSNGWKKKEWPFPGKLVGAAVGKPERISGWRSGGGAGGEPRRLLRAVPAGSVFFFELEDKSNAKKDLENMIKQYHFGHSISDYYPVAGFGIVFFGVW